MPPPLIMSLLAKYEFDKKALSILLKEFIKAKTGHSPLDVEYCLGVDAVGDCYIDGARVICTLNGPADGEIIKSIATGERKIDIGQL